MKIFDYKNYRVFLNDYVKTQSQGIRKSMASAMNISPSLLSQVLNGDRDLNNEQAFKFSQFINLNSTETSYWLLLLDYSKVSSPDLKQYLENRLEEIRRESDVNMRVQLGLLKPTWSEEFISVFYSSWHLVAIYCVLPLQKKWTATEMASRLHIPRARIERAFDFFTKHRIVLKIEDDCFMLNDAGFNYVVSTDSLSYELASIHNAKNFRRKAMDVFEENQFIKDRDPTFRTTTALISADDYHLLKEEVNKLYKSFQNKISSANFEEAVCLNIDLFKF